MKYDCSLPLRVFFCFNSAFLYSIFCLLDLSFTFKTYLINPTWYQSISWNRMLFAYRKYSVIPPSTFRFFKSCIFCVNYFFKPVIQSFASPILIFHMINLIVLFGKLTSLSYAHKVFDTIPQGAYVVPMPFYVIPVLHHHSTYLNIK